MRLWTEWGSRPQLRGKLVMIVPGVELVRFVVGICVKQTTHSYQEPTAITDRP